MVFRLNLSEHAQADLHAAFAHRQDDPGALAQYRAQLEAAFNTLAANPFRFPKAFRGLRRAVNAPLSSAIFYRVQDPIDLVEIVAVLPLALKNPPSEKPVRGRVKPRR